MLPATNRGVGMNIGFPDVCLTPVGPAVVPIPYPNFALTAQAAIFSPVVRVSGVNALNLASMIPMTFGDEPGVAHWTIKGPGRYTMGNPIVFVDRLPAINLTCPTMGNTGNNPIGAVLVPSAVNVFYTYAHPSSTSVSSEAAKALGNDMLGRAANATMTWSMVDDGVGYIRVNVITSDIARQFHLAMKELPHATRGVVVDLRGCPGGDLDATVEWAATFLDEGAEIVRIEDADGDQLIRRATLPATYRMPLAILVHENTASAAEVFTVCLQANHRARIIGRPTYGKTTIQHLVPGQTSAFTYPTVGRWTGPGEMSAERGVLPDDPVSCEADETTWFSAARAALMP